MNPPRKTQKRLAIITASAAILLLIVASTSFGRTLILQQFDAVRLAAFTRRIAPADRAIATASANSVQLTFTDAELEKILRAISSGKSARMPDSVFMSTPGATVTFHLGTNTLGTINMSDQLFDLPGGPQFFDTSTLLNQTIYTPLRQKVNEAYDTETKP